MGLVKIVENKCSFSFHKKSYLDLSISQLAINLSSYCEFIGPLISHDSFKRGISEATLETIKEFDFSMISVEG